MKLLTEKYRIPDKTKDYLNYYYNKYGELEEVRVSCLEVNGNLGLENLPIKELPDNLTVSGYLDLSNTPIKELPDNLTVKGVLCLAYSLIISLPMNLTVGEDLDLRCASIKKLPSSLVVKGNLYIGGSDLESLYETEIREMCKNIDGYINFY